MTKKNITITALAAVLVMAMAAFSFAGPGYGKGYGRGCGGNGYGNSLYSQLTPEKQAAVDKIYEKYFGQFQELRTEMWTKHSTLQAMINGGNADEKAIGKLTADISKLRDKMVDTRQNMAAELEKETGVVVGNGFGSCPRYGQESCPGYGSGQGRGMGQGQGMY
ncbi:Spy/CpxP family protein refolding chaperone [Pseudodesulfovibrio sp. zrk46]|uniref:Spy/CpxP family protein refolding chaperone n=1 Tax=Pseudodesulfovibrio sp. zrk46 TaxID=2725288 RepID=UPI0014492B14|nr:Spy/CpxP family protein refolding chaperone [Pseudodesulfovibrio sp. zrk46]QJB55425.1 Spy/CpxP family protein refolding chaperone [Pseudodesulfovibrio sp. zrk46]